MKKILFILIFTIPTIFAGLIDGIAIIVNNEPITMIEILKTAKTLNISKKKAAELLIDERLQEAQIKKLGITVDDFELENEIEKFAQKKGLSLYEFKEILKQKGIKWEEYKDSFKKQLLKKKFFKKIAATKLTRPDEEEIKEYYKKHLEEFSLPKYVEIVKYISKDKASLQKIMQNPLISIPGIQIGEEKVEFSQINPKIAFLLKDTKEGSFTPIIPFGKQFLTIFVKKKIDITPIPYEQAKNMVLSKMIEEKREKAIKEYLAKLKVSAKIKVLRLP
ncbi:peptidylprolyl isomerase [Nitrosophilus kaiyonis]|uniref:peptidylprolyl isomerase n=1 Tax=Nitrosophilus kaiyonis TaxID=2930200 RepID=UPI0024939717|nr:peptidylprolyl isomerase [Nitrosophilus kaiyonis]